MSVIQIIILITCGLSSVFILWWLGWKAGLKEGYRIGFQDGQHNPDKSDKEWDFKKRRMN